MTVSTHFQHWYPQFGSGLESTLKGSCGIVYDDYLAHENEWCNVNGQGKLGCYVGTVIDCLLSSMPESWKANMAAAAVLLGLLPPTLAVVGPTTTEVGLLALRRPVLAMLLGAGTPAVWPTRAFEYKNIAELLHRQTDSLMLPELRRPFAITIVALQYIVACAAAGNVAHATYQLCVFTMCSFAPETQFLPALWTVLAIVVHLCGSYAVALRTRLHFVDPCGARNFWDILHDEVQLCAQQPGAKLSFRRESYLFVLMSWITSTGTMLHITFGTVVFSSMLFIGTGDAVIIVLRFIVSAAICRMILMFEISGMRQSIDIPDAVSSKGTGETEGLIQGNA